MFRITEDPSAGSLVQCLTKNYKNDSIVSFDMNKVGVLAAYSDPLCVCTHAQRVRICLVRYVHINGHDGIILVIFSQILYKAPDDGSSVIRNMFEHF